MQTSPVRQVAVSLSLLTVVALATVACSSTPKEEPHATTTSHLDQADADFVCSASCSLAAAGACAYGIEAACDKDIYCEGICGYLTSEQKTQLICVRVSPREEICCQNYWGCQNVVDTSCRDGQPC